MAGGTGYNYKTECTLVDGVLRWRSNGRVPPAEHVLAALMQVMAVDVDKCDVVRDAETKAFLDAYRANPPQPDLVEARAELGAGTVMVNVITGQRWQL